MWKPAGNPTLLDLPKQLGDGSIAAWMVTRKPAPTDPLPDISHLPLTDEQEIATFKVAKRVEEHAAGRWLVAYLLEQWGIDGEELSIVRDDYRKPTLSGENFPSISISHSGGFAVALIAPPNTNIGIDCEPLTARNPNLVPLLSAGEERAFLQALWESDETEANRLTNQLWVTKEAIQKACGKGMGIPPQSLNVLGQQEITVDRMTIEFHQWTADFDGELVDLALARESQTDSPR